VLGLLLAWWMWSLWSRPDLSLEPREVPTKPADKRVDKRAQPPAPPPRPQPAELTQPEVPEEVVAPPAETPPEAEVTPKKVRLGSLSRESIDEAMRDGMQDVRDCYLEALEEVPDLAGLLKVRFTIRAEEGVGRVVRASIQDADFDDGPLEDCILDAVEYLEFDPPEGGIVMVTYPFFFEP
jgi:hypothetical protein